MNIAEKPAKKQKETKRETQFQNPSIWLYLFRGLFPLSGQLRKMESYTRQRCILSVLVHQKLTNVIYPSIYPRVTQTTNTIAPTHTSVSSSPHPVPASLMPTPNPHHATPSLPAQNILPAPPHIPHVQLLNSIKLTLPLPTPQTGPPAEPRVPAGYTIAPDGGGMYGNNVRTFKCGCGGGEGKKEGCRTSGGGRLCLVIAIGPRGQ